MTTCITSLALKKQLHFDSAFSVLLYTILLCIINHTFTARGDMSRRKYSSARVWPAKVPQFPWNTTHFFFVMCSKSFPFDGRLKTVLKYLATALLMDLSQK